MSAPGVLVEKIGNILSSLNDSVCPSIKNSDTGCFATFDAAMRSIGAETSIPMTLPVVPTREPASVAASPVPVATSRTRWPVARPASARRIGT